MLDGELEITMRKEKFGSGTVEVYHIEGKNKDSFPMNEFITLLEYLGELGIETPSKIVIIDKDFIN